MMPRGDGKLRHSTNRGQRFAAEPERADAQQILIVELRCGMTIHRQREII